MTAAFVIEGKVYIAHVGDSRLYLFQKGKLSQITKDHSYVMEMVRLGKLTMREANVHPNRNVITRAVGTKETVETDTYIIQIESKDEILICSDGLYTMVPDTDISKIMQKDNISLPEKADALVAAAEESGGLDNISVILVSQGV